MSKLGWKVNYELSIPSERAHFELLNVIKLGQVMGFTAVGMSLDHYMYM